MENHDKERLDNHLFTMLAVSSGMTGVCATAIGLIGKRPIIALGNSDGDFEMLEYTTTEPSGPRLGLFVHHTDADREYAYDRDSHIGQLNRGLDEAPKRDWILINMKKDWKRVFAFEGD